MIQIVIGSSHLWEVLGSNLGSGAYSGLFQALLPMYGSASPLVSSIDDLDKVTVYEALRVFYGNLADQLKSDPDHILTIQAEEMNRVAHDLYHLPEFNATAEDALSFFALHDLRPHGHLVREGERLPVYLPDFSHGARFLGFLTIPMARWKECLQQESPHLSSDALEHLARYKINETISRLDSPYLREQHLDELECHLCDSLRTVYNRAREYATKLWEFAMARGNAAALSAPEPGGDEVLVIDAWVRGFVGTRSLGRNYSDVPPIGRHRLLSAAATRQGIGKLVISQLFPTKLWKQFRTPVKHFLLDAAECVGTEECQPVYPDLPTREEAENLSWQAALKLALHDDDADNDRLIVPLRRLGLEGAFIGSHEETGDLDETQKDEQISHWTRAIQECQLGLYDTDIEQSLNLRHVLDLYPLHKRVLGLLEYALVPGLKDRLMTKPMSEKVSGKLKGVSGLWTAAFTGWEVEAGGWVGRQDGCLSPPLRLDCDLAASIEVEGHWLIEAQTQQTAPAMALGLAGLLDRLVQDISTAPEVTGIRNLDGKALILSLTPGSPGEQAQQLAGLGEKGNPAAACMILYLGKIVISLRNYIEHGHDEVDGACLRIDGSHYWQYLLNEKKTRYQSVLATAARPGSPWRKTGLLPTTPDPPVTANALLLTPASLHRCLVLLSLVLGAGRRQLLGI